MVINKTLKFLSRGVLSENEKFKNRHKGETCYIIGNGASLKSMDLSSFTDHITIPLNFLCLHNDFKLLNAPYYVISAPSFLYSYRTNPYTKKFTKNHLGRAFQKSITEFPDITLFTSLSNYFGFKMVKKINYFHHFGCRDIDINKCDISGNFSFMKGGLHAGIGLAINMGFQKAILVGCDYIFTPLSDGHFYASGPSLISENNNNIYESLIYETNNIMELELITDTAESNWMRYQNYEKYSGKKLYYRENREIVRSEYLDLLNIAYENKQYLSEIF